MLGKVLDGEGIGTHLYAAKAVAATASAEKKPIKIIMQDFL